MIRNIINHCNITDFLFTVIGHHQLKNWYWSQDFYTENIDIELSIHLAHRMSSHVFDWLLYVYIRYTRVIEYLAEGLESRVRQNYIFVFLCFQQSKNTKYKVKYKVLLMYIISRNNNRIRSIIIYSYILDNTTIIHVNRLMWKMVAIELILDEK